MCRLADGLPWTGSDEVRAWNWDHRFTQGAGTVGVWCSGDDVLIVADCRVGASPLGAGCANLYAVGSTGKAHLRHEVAAGCRQGRPETPSQADVVQWQNISFPS